MTFGEFTIEPFFDTVRQILRDLLFQAAQHDGPHPAGEKRARGLRGAAIVLLQELAAIGQVTGMDKFHDAPKIEQAIFERRAGQRELVIGLERLRRAGDHRLGIFDVLRLVENDGAEGEFLQRGEVAAQQRVIGDDEIVLRDFLAQRMAMLARGEQQHLQSRRELLRFAVPVEDNARGTNDEARRRALRFAQECCSQASALHGFAETHVVGQERPELEARGVGEKVEARFLIGTQFGDEPLRRLDFGQALELGHRLAQLADDRVAFAIDESFQLFPGRLLRAGHLPRAELLFARADLDADFREGGHRFGHGGDFLPFHPRAVGKLDVGVVVLMEPGLVNRLLRSSPGSRLPRRPGR